MPQHIVFFGTDLLRYSLYNHYIRHFTLFTTDVDSQGSGVTLQCRHAGHIFRNNSLATTCRQELAGRNCCSVNSHASSCAINVASLLLVATRLKRVGKISGIDVSILRWTFDHFSVLGFRKLITASTSLDSI